MGKLKIGIILGSTREGRLVERVSKFVRATVEKEHEVIIFDPLDMDFPQTQQSLNWMFNPAVIPDNIKELNTRMSECDAIIALSAEYNWSIPPALANIVDNIPPSTFTFKPCAIITYSMGTTAGWRAGMQVRQLFGCVGCSIIQKQMGIAVAQEALDANGKPKDDKLTEELKTTVNQLYWLARALKNHSEKEPKPAFTI